MAYRVLIAEDFKMCRTVFEDAVKLSPNYTLAASCVSAAEAVEYAREHPVDLVLMDVVMNSGVGGLDAARSIKEIQPKAKILIVTSMPEVSYIRRAREIGVESFWYKEVQEQPILEIMDRTMAGESVYPDQSPKVILGNADSAEFTERELEVLREVVNGLSNKEIAAKLGIGAGTVKMHIANLLQKTGFNSRVQLSVRARSCGLVVED